MSKRARAIVFGNHDVGVRGLAVLLAAGVEVPLVVTHEEDPHESTAFASLSEAALAHRLSVALPGNPNASDFIRRVAELAPDFIFSFYYRQLLGHELLQIPPRGALNMHGSLLPHYRGRAPVNWTVVRGETSTGATLHYMTDKPDAGDIVDQQAVPILPDDTAFDVFRKVTVAAEIVLWRSLPGLLSGTAPRKPQDHAAMSYFGRRRPEDGRIDWSAGAQAVHDLVRGVAPPYPGAYTLVRGRRLRILRTMREPARRARHREAALYCEQGTCFIDCADGGVLRIVQADLDGREIAPETLSAALGVDGVIQLQPAGAEEGTT